MLDFAADGAPDVLLALLNATAVAVAPELSPGAAQPAAGSSCASASPSWAPLLSATQLERARMQLLRLASALLATPAVARAPASADTCCTLRSMAVATCFTYLSPASHGDVIMASSLPGCPPTHVAALACAALGTLARDDVSPEPTTAQCELRSTAEHATSRSHCIVLCLRDWHVSGPAGRGGKVGAPVGDVSSPSTPPPFALPLPPSFSCIIPRHVGRRQRRQ